MGWIIRDDHGVYLLPGSIKVQQATNSLEAEGLTLLYGLLRGLTVTDL